jgi:TolA-binding protein
MTKCDATPDTAERYVGGTMAEAERSAFEEHFFGCDACFRTVQALQDARETLALLPAEAQAAAAQPSRRTLPVTWMALAAMLVLSVLVWRLPRQADQPAEPPAATAAPAPAPPASVPAPIAAPVEDPLVRLGRISPPPYVALATRSATDANERTFEQAMTHYSAGRYDQASRALQEITTLDPTLAHALFFLGVSDLMAGRDAPARTAFERVVRIGAAPYADEAHFYLAKAALRAKDLDTARRELRLAVDREAGPRGEASRLLGELKALER